MAERPSTGRGRCHGEANHSAKLSTEFGGRTVDRVDDYFAIRISYCSVVRLNLSGGANGSSMKAASGGRPRRVCMPWFCHNVCAGVSRCSFRIIAKSIGLF